MDRPALLAEALDEITAHGPPGMLRARKWPAGPLSLVHLQVLSALDIDGPLPMGGIADALDVSQASATGIVDRMEQRGLVRRRRDDDDRRVVRVEATDDGHGVLAAMAADRREHLAKVLDQLSDEELAGLLIGVRALRRAREQFHAQHGIPGGTA